MHNLLIGVGMFIVGFLMAVGLSALAQRKR